MSYEVVGRGGAGVVGRRSAVGSLVALPVADALTMLACFAAGGLVNLSYRNVTEERTLILGLLTAGCLVLFQHFGHYSRRRQLWQEFGDIAGIAAVALLGAWLSSSIFGRGEALPPMDEPRDVMAANRAAVDAGRFGDIALEVVPRGYRQDQVDDLIEHLLRAQERRIDGEFSPAEPELERSSAAGGEKQTTEEAKE